MSAITKRLQQTLSTAIYGGGMFPRIQYGPLHFGPPLRTMSRSDLELIDKLEQVCLFNTIALIVTMLPNCKQSWQIYYLIILSYYNSYPILT